MNGELPSNCLACGVCCHSQLETFVRVSGDDWERFGKEAERVAHFIGHRAFLKMQNGHCAALELQRDDEGQRVYFCTIYDRRPQICRDLDRGSPECEGERAFKSGRVVRSE